MMRRFALKKVRCLFLTVAAFAAAGAYAETRETEVYLDSGWKFARFWNNESPKDDAPAEPKGGCAAPSYDTSSWRTVRLPHDWGVEKPFRMDIPGMLGHLGFYGIGWYKTDITLSADECARIAKGGRLYLDFDGAMSLSTVYLNGKDLGTRPFGFISFRVDATDALVPGPRQHLAVRLENRMWSSRWYHGGGLYRRVRRVVVPKVHVDNWGIVVRSEVKGRNAEVTVDVAVRGGEGEVEGTIYDGARAVAKLEKGRATIPDVRLWDVDDPHRYMLEVRVSSNGETDTCRELFGVRTVEFRPKEGLFLNGRHIKFQGVCMHSDCGALGVAAYARVFERQVQLLKEMGCNAIRTTHNPASPEMLEACDKYGMMVLDEPFDMWVIPKGGPNAYSKYFKEWWKKDLTDFIRRDRNRPSVVLWSVGNEVNEQEKPEIGLPIASNLVATCHLEDPTRPVTMGNNRIGAWTNGYVQVVDVYGVNYKADFYGDFYKLHPDKGLLGTETESLLSTRDAYYFPEDDDWASLERPNFRGFYDWQASSYEKYTIRPTNTSPEVEFKAQRKYPQCYGSFVWTGFDYIGEPSPYEGRFQTWHRASSPEMAAEMSRFRESYGTNATPPRSSYYGIFDLCGFPKDRYWCYKAEWRPDVPVAHILPHWTWPGREGKTTPIYVYTNGDSAELFVNGKSYGLRWKDESLRLAWLNVPYSPGTVKVVVRKGGAVWATAERRTAGAVNKLEVVGDAASLRSLQDIAYVRIALKDKNGTVVPNADVDLNFSAEGAVELIGLCNGDPADLTGFQEGHQRTFHGLCQAVVRAREGAHGPGALTITGGGLSGRISFTVPKNE